MESSELIAVFACRKFPFSGVGSWRRGDIFFRKENDLIPSNIANRFRSCIIDLEIYLKFMSVQTRASETHPFRWYFEIHDTKYKVHMQFEQHCGNKANFITDRRCITRPYITKRIGMYAWQTGMEYHRIKQTPMYKLSFYSRLNISI